MEYDTFKKINRGSNEYRSRLQCVNIVQGILHFDMETGETC